MVEWQLPKLHTRVRFPSPANFIISNYLRLNRDDFGRIENESENDFDRAWDVYPCRGRSVFVARLGLIPNGGVELVEFAPTN